jgi:hypothetical protein
MPLAARCAFSQPRIWAREGADTERTPAAAAPAAPTGACKLASTATDAPAAIEKARIFFRLIGLVGIRASPGDTRPSQTLQFGVVSAPVILKMVLWALAIWLVIAVAGVTAH